MIIAKNITRTFKTDSIEVNALRRVNLQVNDGEFIAIMGLSGSGKSTLLHILGGIDVPTTGSIKVDNVFLSQLPEEQRAIFRLEHVGFVFQFFSLLPEFTAIENVMLPALAHGTSHVKCEKKAAELLEKLGLEAMEYKLPSQLSGGEQQRVAIARALVNNPRIIFADEPTANLDYETGLNVVKVFREINAKYKQTIVMVTHEEPYAKLADRTIILHDGRIAKKI